MDTAGKTRLNDPLINIDEDWSVDYWKTTLGVPREELVAAVRAVGGSVQAVTDYLAKKSAAGPSS